ncbi:aromatic amino acid transaminase [Neptunomonas antarctica]|uniref:Aspartate aminotransferase n=1 Tax=Neptunomonas antarctica TaxID=619304 RepID=A0A1N7KLV8_9GAMM|nr:amino acid aminotransferase [Neptunomonas antarctica]SIS62585.1 aspartate aminotransferase [Neptunomonas antarctica]
MFEHLHALPADPILNLMVQYRQDNNPLKVDLGVGVYKDEQGHTAIMQAVTAAETHLLATETTKTYIGPAGAEGFNYHISRLLLGNEHSALKDKRITVAQTPGGCGALRMAAEFLAKCAPDTTVWVSDPTWANHIPLLKGARLNVTEYPYYDGATKAIRFDAMCSTLESANAGDVVLLHGCCHNPCGADLSTDQWDIIAELLVRKGLIPFVDIAYQGLGDGLDEDAYGVRLLADKAPEMLIASSCSKNFGLYRERTGSVMIIAPNQQQAAVTASNLFSIIRSHYSMPPAHGAAIVETILSNTELTKSWGDELAVMRNRILQLRHQLANDIAATGCTQDFSFIPQQKGMFSFLGINKDQVGRLRDEYSIYMVDSSRINIAGLSSHNLNYVAQSLSNVLKG